MKKLERNKRIFLTIFVSSVIALFLSQIIINNIQLNNNVISDDNSGENLTREDLPQEPKLSASIPNAKPLLISQSAKIEKEYLSNSLPMNASYTLVEDWVSKNTTINFEDISWEKDHVINGDFATTINPWQFYAKDSCIINYGRQFGGYVQLEITMATVHNRDYGYYQETFSVNEPLNENKLATLSFDLYYDEYSNDKDYKLYMAVIIDGIEKNNTISFLDIETQIWQPFSMTYNPFTEGQTTPNDVTVRLGVYFDSQQNEQFPDRVWFDNIEFNCWTKPNQPYIVGIKDLETSLDHKYQNTTYGKGQVFIDKERSCTQTEDVKFTISENFTGVNDFEVNNITIKAPVIKLANSTISGIKGSKYTINNDITWNAEWDVDTPPNYLNNKIEIEKPADWNVTQILDEFDVDQKEHSTGLGIGSSKILIPEGYLSEGLWKLEAISQNYVDALNNKVWNGTSFVNTDELYVGDLFQVNMRLNDSISLANSIVNITIYHPNGSVFWKDSQEPTSYIINLANLTVGLNMTLGRYKVLCDWRNSDETVRIDKVGQSQIDLIVIHNTSLEVQNLNIERIAGEPLIIMTYFTDEDLDTSIALANVIYNTSYGEQDALTYVGSGTYIVDLDTSLLGVGDYFVSFKTSNIYYKNLTINNIIKLTIKLETLSLEAPRKVISVSSNSYAIFQFNITGEKFGAPISTNNITTDWNLYYIIKEHNTGNYTLNVSTYEVTSGIAPETFYITIDVNKSNYGSASDFVVLTVYPITTLADVNTSLVEVSLNNNFSIKVNYTIEETGDLISGADCSVLWAADYYITVINDEFIIEFNTTGFLLEGYSIFINLERRGYAPAYKSVYVIIKPISSELSILNQPLDFIKGDMVNITCRFYSNGQNIANGNLTLIGDFSGDLEWNGTIYYYTLNTSELAIKSYYIQILAQAINYQTHLKETLFKISPLVINIQIASTVIKYNPSEAKNLTVTINDESHGLITTSLNVTYEFGAKSDSLLLLANGSFCLDLNDLYLSPRIEPYQLKIIVINPYGDNVEIILNIITPVSENPLSISSENGENGENVSRDDIIIYYLMFLGVLIAITGGLVGYIIKRKYFNLTKFQRDIRKLKEHLFKNKFDRIPQLTREEVINEIISEKIKK